LAKIPKIKMTIPLFAASILAIAIVSYSPMDVSAYDNNFTIPEISGTITVSESFQDYASEAKIALSVAMVVHL